MDKVFEKLKIYGADIEGIMGRFVNDVELYHACLITYVTDQAFVKLGEALRSKNYDSAFEYAHALKGTTGNMGLTPLYDITCALVEDLRKNQYANVLRYYGQILKHLNQIKIIIQID
ncbi:MAG: Hpt domain-containing protein [Clostridia bacterium]